MNFNWENLIILTVFVFFPWLSMAEENKEKNKDTKTQVISFEDQLVEGSTKRPDLFYLLQKKNFRYKRLIKLRENFLPEISATAEDLESNGDVGEAVEE